MVKCQKSKPFFIISVTDVDEAMR